MELLLVDTHRGLRRSVPLQGALTFGQAEDCDVILGGAGILPRHFRLEPRADGWFLTAFRSHPGVIVNGQRLRLSPFGSGDVLEVGVHRIFLVGEAGDEGDGEEAWHSAAGGPAEDEEDSFDGEDARRRRQRRRTWARRVSAFCTLLLIGGVGFGAWLLFRPEAEADAPRTRPRLALLRLQAEVLAGEGRFDEAEALLEGVVPFDLDAKGREELLRAEQALASLRDRHGWGTEAIRAAQQLAADGQTLTAVRELQKVAREYGDLPSVREPAWQEAERLRATLPDAAREEALLDQQGVPLSRERLLQIHESLLAEEYGRAVTLTRNLKGTSDQDWQVVEEVREYVRRAVDAAGAEYLGFARELLADGRLLVVLNMLDEEAVRHFRGTEAWYQMLELADQVEDLIDERVPDGFRPFPRRDHARRRPDGAQPYELKVEELGPMPGLDPVDPLDPLDPVDPAPGSADG